MSAPPDTAHALEPGAIFHGRYQVVRRIAAGGMGAVYEVIHLGTQKHRALKVMLPSAIADPDLRARFQREATVTSVLESEHIVEVLDADVDEATGSPFLVMELLRGEDLARLVGQEGPLSPSELVALLAQVARALAQTHARGIVHRDLKPENLFLTRRDDGSPRVKVLDFGIAKVVQSGATMQATRTLGSPLYMAPEQIRGAADIGPAADLYSLAHIAYALLVGEAYFTTEARHAESIYPLLIRVTEAPPEPASRRAAAAGIALPAAFDGWFARAAAPDPVARFESGSSLVAELAVALDVPRPDLPEGTRLSAAPGAREPLSAVPEATTGGRIVVPTEAAPPVATALQVSSSTGAVASELPMARPSGGHVVRRRGRRILAVVALAAVAGTVGAVAVVTLFGKAAPLAGADSATAAAHGPGGASGSASVASAVSSVGTARGAATAVDASAATRSLDAAHVAGAASVVVTSSSRVDSSSPLPAPPVRTTSPPASPSPKPPAACNPPYTVGPDGIRRYRPECL